MPEPVLRSRSIVVKNTSMQWNEYGAVVSSSVPFRCPRCEAHVKPGIEHRCGDRILREPRFKVLP